MYAFILQWIYPVALLARFWSHLFLWSCLTGKAPLDSSLGFDIFPNFIFRLFFRFVCLSVQTSIPRKTTHSKLMDDMDSQFLYFLITCILICLRTRYFFYYCERCSTKYYNVVQYNLGPLQITLILLWVRQAINVLDFYTDFRPFISKLLQCFPVFSSDWRTVFDRKPFTSK